MRHVKPAISCYGISFRRSRVPHTPRFAKRLLRWRLGLYQRGVRQRSVVAIMLPNVPEYPLAWLALARLGAVAVPVNPQYTPREIQYVLADSGASCVIVHDVGASAVDSVIASLPGISPDRVFVVGEQAQGHEPFEDLLHGA